jgi:hypothetical protein
MDSDRNASGPGEEFVAAVEGLAQALGPPASVEPPLLAAVLERVGDVLRLPAPVPAAVRGWCRALNREQLGRALDVIADECARWPRVTATERDGEAAFAIRRRDEAESASVALTWICLEHGWSPAEIPGLDRCLEGLANYDHELAHTIDRDTAEALLADRALLLEPSGWTVALAEPTIGDPAATPDLNPALLTRPPSDQVVQEYLTSGAHQLRVEGCAQRSPAFATELADCFDTLAAMGEKRSLAARVWHKRHSRPVADFDPVAYVIEPGFFGLAAASSTETEPETSIIALGPLPGFPAEATLEVSPGRVTLFVFAAVPLIRVELATATATQPDAEDRWSVATALAPGALPIRITAADGRIFEERLELVAPP